MKQEQLESLLRALVSIDGVSGDESRVRDFILAQIEGFCDYEIDALGNVLGSTRGTGEGALLLTAHMDEVGLIVTEVEETGFLRFDTVGGIDARVLPDKRVTIHGVPGVICCKPVHLMKAEEKKKPVQVDGLVIDIGARSREEAERLVARGDMAAFEREYTRFGEAADFVCAPALDDRAGCALLVSLIRAQTAAFRFAFTVQEEVGTRGAYAAAFSLRPAVAVAVETTTAADVSGVEDGKSVARLGGGPVLSFMDRGTIYDRGERQKIAALAEENGIRWQQ